MGNAKSVLKLDASSSGILGEFTGPEEQAAIKNTKLYSFWELRGATGNFASENRIGQGGFGYTYKGVLPDGTLIAAKVRSGGSAQGNEEFMNEIYMLVKLKHVNLVRLYGCCLEADHVILVYDYLKNGDLARALLRDGPRGLYFPWDVRRRICAGVAEGLSFLHAADIVHRDITASNVLLDDELNPKIGDFGLARVCPPDMSHVSEPRIVGTYGYMAPEYALHGWLTVKADTYSFGVLMLEIVSGRSNRNIDVLAEGKQLLDRAWDLHERGELLELVDKSIEGGFDMEEAYRYLIISLLCTHHDPDLRPDMSTVIGMLTGKIDVNGENLSRPSFLSRNISPRADEGEEQDWGSHFSFSPATIDSDDQLVGTELVNVVNKQKFERGSGSTSQSHLENEGSILMRAGLGLTEAPKIEEWLSAKEIYLMQSQLAELPESPRCPKLKALFMHRNYKLRRLPISFFEYMPALQVLNLSRTRIKTLPDSLFGLHSLKRLFLNHCEVLSVLSPKIGELKELEVLDLHGTEIFDLPKEIAGLTNLRCLELSFCCHFDPEGEENESNVLIPKGTVAALSQLEELSIDVDPEDQRWEKDVGAILDDIRGLRMLSTLKLYWPYVEHLMEFNWYSMPVECFKFTVGRHVNRIMSRFPRDLAYELERWDRCLEYVNGVTIPIGIKKVLYHSTAFFLDRHASATSLSEFGIGNMQQLKCCILGECNEVRYILDGFYFLEEGASDEIISEYSFDEYNLGSLEYLNIYYLRSLKGIYRGPYREFFCNLRSLTLRTCPELIVIFTPELLGDLSSLEELIVEDCEVVTSLLTCEDSSIFKSSSFLPKLKRMSLHYLPRLVSISRGLRIAPNLELLSLRDCPNLSLSMEEVGSKRLTKIKGPSSLSLSTTSSSEAEESGTSRGKSVEVEAKGKLSETKPVDVDNEQKTPEGKSVEGEAKHSRSWKKKSNSGKGIKLPVPAAKPVEETVATLNLRIYTLGELKIATRNFRPDPMLGEGGFSRVFKGWVDEKTFAPSRAGSGIPVAVKALSCDSRQEFQAFQSEVEFWGRYSHPNLVRLIGYCWEDNQFLLVYEFMQKRSLGDNLFKRGPELLSWDLRIKIAIGAACGLNFLHTSEKSVVYRDFKSSNILLDGEYNAKLSDFGLAMPAPAPSGSHLSTRVMGTYGYAAPEYIATGHLYVKSDVYGFGVVLLEMLTGRRALDSNRRPGEHSLVEWARPLLSNKRRLMRIMDPRFEGQYPMKGAAQAAQLVLKCLEADPKNRPSMDEVLTALEAINSVKEKRKQSKPSSKDRVS